MYKKVTHLEALALKVFFAFVRTIQTIEWINGIEINPAKYQGKPSDGDRRSVTVWQGSDQWLEIHFFYNLDYGGWNLGGVVFSGITTDENGKNVNWSQAFRGGSKYNDEYTWRFTPVQFDGKYFKDYDLREPAQNAEFEAACKGKFPRTQLPQ